ncbi:MAG: hypothetical protein NVSMB5_16960 [Candidatus Velthaea sp.]
MALASAYHNNGVPVTWMIGNPQYLAANAQTYDDFHRSFGDDIQGENSPALIQLLRSAYPWYTPTVSIEGAGRERNISGALAMSESAFGGITWNSLGTDMTSDRGAPWGSYCADVSSYKRPAPDGSCKMLAIEWTARDLTRAYFSSREDAFSTDPEDIVLRAFFDGNSGAQYARSLVDAYAAAGETQQLIMVAQEESAEADSMPADAPILGALASEAVATKMRLMTLAQAVPAIRDASNRPRAVAFPFIAGGQSYAYRSSPISPGTIDYHDSKAGMTFIAGHTTPSRIFPYALESTSTFAQPLPEFTGAVALTRVAYQNGRLYFHFSASNATHYGVAIWSDPSQLGLDISAIAAGRAGAIVPFDLPSGESDQSLQCTACAGSTFAYSY